MATKKKPAGGSPKPDPESEKFMEQLKQFVRTEGAEYLRDDNITSVGIGYKQKDGKRTDEVSVQFTVGRKVVPEALAALDTTPIPESFVIGGVEVPTDVIQRDFVPDFRVVAESTASRRKSRINPIVPGVSVANRHVTAGTVGCIVFDRRNGSPYVLSNWHILHGPDGEVGDDVVQPGPHDDNRIQLNRLGRLVRSHLGAAGDCAVASIEDRSFRQEILDLDVAVEQLGEPELDDKVIKSGRTTAVTHGIVTRVHTIAKLDYGGSVGEQSIGAFEIGPDPGRPAPNDEISMGGDSGAVWLFKASNGKPTKVMAGLHFGGEGEGDPNEHALACYPKSVFEKLDISLTRPVVELVEEVGATGYSPNFLGTPIDVPRLSSENRKDAFKLNGLEVIPYTHFSLTLSKSRRFARWVAWNIDGGQLKKVSRNGIPFVFDPRIPEEFQVGDELYSNNRLDRGHIARRADLLWGGLAEARRANRDSFFFTNITPQMDDFNQSTQGGIWGQLEDAVFDEVDVEDLRVTLFGGPILRDDDRVFRGVRIPREFFKVLAYVEGGELQSKAFLLTQSLDLIEALDLDQFRVFQVSLGEIEQRCGFTFPDALREADDFAERVENLAEALVERGPLTSLDDIAW